MLKKALNRNPKGCTAFSDRWLRLCLPGFCGQACLHRMLAFTQPLVKEKPIAPPNRFTIADTGYAWLTLLPDEGLYAVTGILQPSGEVYQVYVDLLLDRGEGWFLDAYADVILFDDHRVLVDDLDELAQACVRGEMTPAQRTALEEEARRLQEDMLQNPNGWFSLVRQVYTYFIGGNDDA